MVKSKDNDRLVRAMKEKMTSIYKRNNIRTVIEFPYDIFQARKERNDILEVLNIKIQPRVYCPAKLSFRLEGGIRTFQINRN